MMIHCGRIKPAPAKPGSGRIRAKLYNQRLGLKEILIERVGPDAVDALAITIVPEVGELLTILLPTGSEVHGVVSWVKDAAFSVTLDREANGVAAAG
jgi:hypothetical protein